MSIDLNLLKYRAYQLRVGSLEATTAAQSGHLTTALSAADIVAALFFYAMKYDIQDPQDPQNDRFILSKGHGVPVLYAAYWQLGVLSLDQLRSYRQFDSLLEGHPTPRFIYNEAATGSLGQGLSIGLGMALAQKYLKTTYHTYVLLGDSEMAEGSVWEAIQLAPVYQAQRLIAIVDLNRLGQSTESIDDHAPEQHAVKWAAFGWHTIIVDGHNMAALVRVLDEAKLSTKPVVIIAKTYKGYGLDNMEDLQGFHGKAMPKDMLPPLRANLKERFADVSSMHVEHAKHVKHAAKHAKHIAIKLPAPTYKKGESIAPRLAYGQTLVALGRACQDLLVLDAEVKNSTYAELFEREYPSRFIQCYIAEQNMIGMASGLTSRGLITFSSTFACFLTRAHDQLRMSAIGRVALRIAGSHVGVSIGADGPSQMGLEDIGVFRALPESVIFYPSDATSTYHCVNLMAHYHDGISYVRLTRSALPVLYDAHEKFTIGGCKILKQSDNDVLCIIAAGITLHEALKAYETLKAQNISVSIIDLYSIKPFDRETVLSIARKSQNKLLVVEDHYKQGGIFEMIAASLVNEGVELHSLAINELPRSGTEHELLHAYGIDDAAIAKKIQEIENA